MNSPTPGTPQTAHKAIAAALTGTVGILAMFIPGIEDVISPEVIAAIATIAAAVLVYAIPNQPK